MPLFLRSDMNLPIPPPSFYLKHPLSDEEHARLIAEQSKWYVEEEPKPPFKASEETVIDPGLRTVSGNMVTAVIYGPGGCSRDSYPGLMSFARDYLIE